MTERKPHEITFETWVDRQVREAEQRGDFDNLPGAGKPLPDISGPDDELWWVHKLMKREGLVYLPPTLALQKEAEEVLATVDAARSEADVRRTLTELNDKIRDAIAKPPSGPPLRLAPYDVEQLVAQWRARQPAPQPVEATAAPRKRVWRRRTPTGKRVT